MMTYQWNEEEHQKFLRIKHPNYYAMDFDEKRRQYEEAQGMAIKETMERVKEMVRASHGLDGPPNPVRTTVIKDKQDTIDVECEVISSTPLTQDDERTGLLPEKG